MLPIAENPLGVLTFIAAPAILTNSSSVMALGTANRFARAIDRARVLSAQVERQDASHDPLLTLRLRQLRAAERRAQILVRALTAFYVSVGSFSAASLVSLLAAALFVAGQELALRQWMLAGALVAGVIGVAGLVAGSALLVFETRMTLRILQAETELMLLKREATKSSGVVGGE